MSTNISPAPIAQPIGGQLLPLEWQSWFAQLQNNLRRGFIDGGGTINTIPKFTSTQTLGNSSITDDGSDVVIDADVEITGNLGVDGSADIDIDLNVDGDFTAGNALAINAIDGVTSMTGPSYPGSFPLGLYYYQTALNTTHQINNLQYDSNFFNYSYTSTGLRITKLASTNNPAKFPKFQIQTPSLPVVGDKWSFQMTIDLWDNLNTGIEFLLYNFRALSIGNASGSPFYGQILFPTASAINIGRAWAVGDVVRCDFTVGSSGGNMTLLRYIYINGNLISTFTETLSSFASYTDLTALNNCIEGFSGNSNVTDTLYNAISNIVVVGPNSGLGTATQGPTLTVNGDSDFDDIIGGTWKAGTIQVGFGGTGATTLALNGVLYGGGSSAVSALAVNASATTAFLSQASSAAPAWVSSTGTGVVMLQASPTTTGTLTAAAINMSGNLAIATNKFTVAAASGNTLVAGTFDVTGNVAVNTNKFTVAASSGNTAVAGTFNVTGAVTLTVALTVANGGTGATTLASNGVLYGNGTSAIQALAVNASATASFLSQSSSTAPTWVSSTGTGNVMLAASPTTTGTFTGAAANFSGAVTFGTYTGQTSIVTLGTVTTGTWQATSISTTYTDAKIKTVTGTSNRLTIGGTSTDPTFDISTSYVGQATITTLGTITTGVWNAGAVTSSGTIAGVDLSLSGNILFTSAGSSYIVGVNTVDGTDSSRVILAGGATGSVGRGGSVIVNGNEQATNPGCVRLIAGNASGSIISSELLDNQSGAWVVKEASNNYISIDTTNGSELVTIAKNTSFSTTVTTVGVHTFTAQPIFSSATASTAAAFDSSKGIISVTNTGSGNNVLGTSPTFTTSILYTTTDMLLAADTADASDNKRLIIAGGGAGTNSRGGSIVVAGNEHSGTGEVRLTAGNVSGGAVNVVMRDDQAAAFTIKEGSNSYVTIDTTNSAELITFAKAVTFSSTALHSGTTQCTSNVKIGSGSITSAFAFDISGTAIMTGADQYAFLSGMAGSSSATSSITGVYSTAKTAAASFTCTNAYDFYAEASSKGAGSTITNKYGLYINNQNSGGTINCSIQTLLGNIAFFKAGSWGGGAEVIYIGNATTNPSTNPSNGGVLYVDSGALKYRGSSGTVTTLGAA